MIFCRITFLAMMAMGLGITLAEHGKPRTGTHNFGITFISSVIQLLLLWGGGFFS